MFGKARLSLRMTSSLAHTFHPHNRRLKKGSIPDRDLLRSRDDRVNEFCKCWIKYFAPNFLPRNKWFRTREDVKVGDLVLELDNKYRRSQWRMALIIDTYPGNDNHVRKVRIKTANGEYDRPIHKLCYSQDWTIKGNRQTEFTDAFSL